MSIKITCKANNFVEYIKSYSYIIPRTNTGLQYPCFLKATVEFEEWFEYIIDFFAKYDLDCQSDSYKEMLTYNNFTFVESRFSFIDNNDYFTFEFPDEETALYFQLKFDLT